MATVSAALLWKDLSGDPNPGWNTVRVHRAPAFFTFLLCAGQFWMKTVNTGVWYFTSVSGTAANASLLNKRILKPLQWQTLRADVP